MATYQFPYPAGTVNRAAHYITREGDDLLMHFSPRSAEVDTFDRFVGYYLIDWASVNAAAGTPMQAPTQPAGYVAPSGVVTNGSAVVPVVNPTPTNSPATIVPDAPVSGQIVKTQIEVREGDDLVIYYPNGQVDRFRDYFNPQGAAVPVDDVGLNQIPPNPNPGGFVKPLVSDIRTGNDRYVRFNDGTEKILTNYFLPHLPNNQAENNGKYIFGTGVTDPEYLKLYGKYPDQKFLVQDRQDGTDRLAIYSDGSSLRVPGWYSDPGNAAYLQGLTPDAPDPVFFGPDTPQSTYVPPEIISFVPPVFVASNPNYETVPVVPTGVPPSSVTLPTNLSGNVTGGLNQVANQQPTPQVAVNPLPNAPGIPNEAVILALFAIAALLVS